MGTTHLPHQLTRISGFGGSFLVEPRRPAGCHEFLGYPLSARIDLYPYGLSAGVNCHVYDLMLSSAAAIQLP